MKFIKDRNLIIIAIVLILLVGGYYVTNSNKKTEEKSTTKQEDQVKLDEEAGKTSEDNKTTETPAVTSKNVVSTDPTANASLTTKPTSVSVKVDKALAAGSEIKVVSDKNVDVVTSGNKLSSDLKNLSVPVAITVVGTYTVSYSLNWAVGGTTTGSYKFTVK